MDGKAPLVKVGSNECRIFTNICCHYNSFAAAYLNGNWKKSRITWCPITSWHVAFPLLCWHKHTNIVFWADTVSEWLVALHSHYSNSTWWCTLVVCAVLLCVRVCVCVCVWPHIFTRTCAAARNPVRAKTVEVQAKADSNTIAWIGNSFVYYNCMPSMLQEMLSQDGIFLKQEELLIGSVFSFPQYPTPIPKLYTWNRLRVLDSLLIRIFQLCDV